MSSINEYLNYLDILSFSPKMKIKGNTRFVTNLGKILSIMCILSILTISFKTIMDVLYRKYFTIVYNLDNREIPKIQINESQIAINLLDPLGREIQEHDRVFFFTAKFLKIEIPNNYSQTTNDYVQTYLPRNTIIDLPLRNCSYFEYTKFPKFYETFSKVYNSGKCIDSSNLNDPLYGKYGGTQGYSFLTIYIRKCMNNTAAGKTDCYPEEIIDKRLSQIFLSFVNLENDIDSNNYDNPILNYHKNEILPLSSTIFKNYLTDINSVKFLSDDGYFFSNENQYISYRTDRIIESVDLRGKNTLFPGTFSQLTIRCSGKTEIYSRYYSKIPATFAYIEGIFQAIIILGKIVIFFFSKNSMFYYLAVNFFDSDQIKSLNGEEININRKIFLKENMIINRSNPDINEFKSIEPIKMLHININKQSSNNNSKLNC